MKFITLYKLKKYEVTQQPGMKKKAKEVKVYSIWKKINGTRKVLPALYRF